MKIRYADASDLPRIMCIYEYARLYMARNGNATQWGKNNPPVSLIEEDIKAKRLYVLEESGHIIGVFVFFIGEEATYAVIREGTWLSENTYGVIHRVASSGEARGIMNAVISFCEQKISHLRIDTHSNNATMRHILEKNGFQMRGIICVADGTSRVAYEKCPAS